MCPCSVVKSPWALWVGMTRYLLGNHRTLTLACLKKWFKNIITQTLFCFFAIQIKGVPSRRYHLFHQRFYNPYSKRQHKLVRNVKTNKQKAKYGGAVAVFCLHGKAGFLCEPLSSFNIERGMVIRICCIKINLFSVTGGKRIATSLGSKHWDTKCILQMLTNY